MDIQAPESVIRVAAHIVEKVNVRIPPEKMDEFLMELEMTGVDVDAFGDLYLRDIIDGKLAITRDIGNAMCKHFLQISPADRAGFLSLCQQAHEQAVESGFPVIPHREVKSYEPALAEMEAQHQERYTKLVTDCYRDGKKFGHVVAGLLELEQCSAEDLAEMLESRLEDKKDYSSKDNISGGYLRHMATHPDESQPRATVIDMLAHAYAFTQATELMLHKMSRGSDINIEKALADAQSSNDKSKLVDALLQYSGISESAITRFTGIPHPTIHGWHKHGMTPDSSKTAEDFIKINYHKDLIRNEDESKRYSENVEKMLALMTNRPLDKGLDQLLEEASKDEKPSVKLINLLLGRHGIIDLSEAQQMQLLDVSRDMLYKMKAGQLPLFEEHATCILNKLKCVDPTLRENATSMLTGIEPPQNLFAQVRSGQMTLTDMIRKVMDRKGCSITDTEKATGYTRLGPFLQQGAGLKKHHYARKLAEFCGLSGDEAREFTVRAVHGTLSTYNPAEVLAAQGAGINKKETRKTLVKLSGMDGHELAASSGVPHWIITDWVASGRFNQLQPAAGAFAKALGIGAVLDDEECRKTGEALLIQFSEQGNSKKPETTRTR
jgi:hypothetical protein